MPMPITIDIPKELQEKLEAIAHQEGRDVKSLIIEFLKEKVAPGESSDASARELELLQRVHLGIAVEDWERYHELVKKREGGTLTQAEHEELLRLVNRVELANAERMKFLVELAVLRQEPLEDLMMRLGIGPQPHDH